MSLLYSGDSEMLTLCRRDALMGCNLRHVDSHVQDPAECPSCLTERGLTALHEPPASNAHLASWPTTQQLPAFCRRGRKDLQLQHQVQEASFECTCSVVRVEETSNQTHFISVDFR